MKCRCCNGTINTEIMQAVRLQLQPIGGEIDPLADKADVTVCSPSCLLRVLALLVVGAKDTYDTVPGAKMTARDYAEEAPAPVEETPTPNRSLN